MYFDVFHFYCKYSIFSASKCSSHYLRLFYSPIYSDYIIGKQFRRFSCTLVKYYILIICIYIISTIGIASQKSLREQTIFGNLVYLAFEFDFFANVFVWIAHYLFVVICFTCIYEFCLFCFSSFLFLSLNLFR